MTSIPASLPAGRAPQPARSRTATTAQVGVEDRPRRSPASVVTAKPPTAPAPEPDARLRKAFLAVIGHELRTPISSIVAGAELLQRGTLDSTTRDEVTNLVVEEAHRLNIMIEQLTALTLLQTLGSKAEVEPVHLLHLARRIGAREARRRPAIRLQVPPLRPSRAIALADDSYVAQVLTILIDNAAKYAGHSGEVEIVLEDRPDEVGVHVLDNGPGLRGADPRRLFELFERAPLHRGDGGGTGIGLYVASQIVAAMHGRVWAVDRPGGGADFGFALPAAM